MAVAELSFRLTRLPTRVVGSGACVADGELGHYGSGRRSSGFVWPPTTVVHTMCFLPPIINSCSWCHATKKKHLLASHSRRKLPPWMPRGVPTASGAYATHWGGRALSVSESVWPGPADSRTRAKPVTSAVQRTTAKARGARPSCTARCPHDSTCSCNGMRKGRAWRRPCESSLRLAHTEPIKLEPFCERVAWQCS